MDRNSASHVWHGVECGRGRPLILLHGIGMSHAAWKAVLPRLCATRHVVAFDIPGFGATPPLPSETPPTVAHLVDALGCAIRRQQIDVPVDIAGNSLGAVMALEAARRGLARTVVAISPPCLWKSQPPAHVKPLFGTLRFAATHFPDSLKAALRAPWIREALLAVPISVGSRRMPIDDARRAIDDLRRSTAFEETFAATRSPFAGRDITVPVTVAFGDRDWILPKGSRRRDTLPVHARWIERSGWGHVPMWVDPDGVAGLILEGTR